MKASEGYLLAKREMQRALDYRAEVYAKAIKEAKEEDTEDYDRLNTLLTRQEEVEQFRNFVRNSMLWNSSLED